MINGTTTAAANTTTTFDRLLKSEEPLCQGLVDAFDVVQALSMTASMHDLCGDGFACPCTRGADRCWLRPAN